MMTKVILWFRRDLRLSDHPALAWALSEGAAILPIYIHSPDEEAPWQPGGASRWWLHNSLQALAQELDRHGLRLHCFRGNAMDVVPRLAQATHADVTANRLYEPHLHARDDTLIEQSQSEDWRFKLFDANLWFTPGSIQNQQGQPYKVFTPFWRTCRSKLESEICQPDCGLPAGKKIKSFACPIDSVKIDALQLLDPLPWHDKLRAHWQPGESSAWATLERFLDHAVENYQEQRDRPAQAGTSRLSPHLHFGEITPRQILYAILPQLHAASGRCRESLERFLAELGWREFAHHVLWHFPDSDHQSLNPKFRDDFWQSDDGLLRAWQKGEAGIPLVDAGMRELWETGWMHNRVRMVVGSFLTKNLGLHWREGARWFWDTLVDADLANNSMGWQWIAGCGVDAAPYDRIFNPEIQAQKFDPEGQYLERWLPSNHLAAPIVDLKQSRMDALKRYAQIKQR